MPVAFGNEDIVVYFENPFNDSSVDIEIADEDGSLISRVGTFDIDTDDVTPFVLSKILSKEDADTILCKGQLFRIRYEYGRDNFYTSCLLRYASDTEGLSVLKYRCNEDCFGFPFASYGGEASVLLPILLSKPQYNQEDKVYTKSNGQTVVLYAQARKEWSGETEYLPEDMHDKIAVALMCDEVSINGRRVFKSGQYNVDWESYDTLSDGTKTARATFAVEENTVSRNSNY